MSDRDQHLVPLLQRASEGLPATDLTGLALRASRIRRRRRTTVAAGGAVLAVVVTTVGLGGALGGLGRSAPDPAAPSLSVPDWVPERVVAPPLNAEDLRSDDSVRLPSDLTPGTPTDNGAPLSAAVQEADGTLTALTSFGQWVEMAELPAGTLFRSSLSAEGDAIAVRSENGFGFASVARSVAGELTPRVESDEALWLGRRRGLLYDIGGEGGEVFEVGGSERTPVAFPDGDVLAELGSDSSLADATVATNGDLVQLGDGVYSRWSGPSELQQVVSVPDGLSAPVASGTRVAARVESEEREAAGVVVLDDDLRPTAYLPVPEVAGAELTLHRWLDDDRVLLQADRDLLVWDAATGQTSRVSTLPDGATLAVAGAGGLVRNR